MKNISAMLSYEDWEEVEARHNLEEHILAYVQDNDWVTFAELDGFLSSRFDIKGDHTVGPVRKYNVVFWGNMSREYSDTLLKLLANRKLFVHPASVALYFVDGKLLDLPLARSFREYKKTHWLPVQLRCVPMQTSRRVKE